MTSLQQLITHLFSVAVVVGAGLALAVTGHIDGATAVAMISGVTGLSLGVGAVSIGVGQSSPQTSAGGASNGTNAAPIP
jgi:hypothetical protein